MDLKTECALSFYQEMYRITQKVWVVRNVTDQRVYVRKLHPQWDPHLYQVLKESRHPGLAAVYELYSTPEGLVSIEQFVNGVTLEDYVARRGCLTEEEAVRITVGIAQALRFLHSRNPPIIHRDIKLSNIMVDDQGVPRIVDFDASRQFRAQGDKDTQILGTVGYAAPEQYGFMQTDARSDLYSLGVLLSKMLNGLEEGANRYTGRLNAVIDRCTRFSPQDRYQDMDALLLHLNQLSTAGSPSRAKSRGTARRLAPPGFRTGKVWKMVLAVLGYLLVAYLCLSYNPATHLPVVRFLEKGWILLLALSLIALYANYLNIHAQLPLVSQRHPALKALGLVVCTLLFLFVYLAVLLLIHIFFGIFP